MHYTLVATSVPESRKKTYKIALAKLRVWKISTHNMCEKGSKSCKNAKNFTHKKQKPREKQTKISTAVKNKQARPLRTPFSTSDYIIYSY